MTIPVIEKIRQHMIFCATSATYQDGDSVVTLMPVNAAHEVHAFASVGMQASAHELMESPSGPAAVIVLFRIAAECPDTSGEKPSFEQREDARNTMATWVLKALERHDESINDATHLSFGGSEGETIQ